MGFFLSPGVYVKEIDATTTIPAVSTNISVFVLRDTWKGTEQEKHFISNDGQLIDLTGKPNDKSYIDILSVDGFLKFGSMAYVSIVRPDDATFSGIKLEQENSNSEFTASYTYDVEGNVDEGQDDGPYDYTSLGITDLKGFSEQVESEISETDDVLWAISNWRGISANRTRILVFNYDVYKGIRYLDEVSGDISLPAGESISAAASAATLDMYNEGDVTTGYTVIRNTDMTLSSDYQLGIIVQFKDQESSIYDNKEFFVVSTDEDERDDNGSPMFIDDVINENSRYIKVALNPKYKTTTDIDNGVTDIWTHEFVDLAGGKNGYWGRHDSEVSYDGEIDAASIKAYGFYSNPDEIDVNLFIDAGKSETVKNYLIQLCQDIRKDSMTILDVPKTFVLNNRGKEASDITRWRKGQNYERPFNPNSSYAALYGNWLEVFDKWNKKYRWIPSSGYVAGIYANTDGVSDPWFAPAGLERAILTGVRRLAWNPDLGERNLLYMNGVNPIVSFAGQGKTIWGNKNTLDRSSSFNRVNVRRLFLVLEKAIAKSSKYFIFQQNDEVTWMLMTNMIEPFLRNVKGRRGITDFKVQIDATTNTPFRIDNNELHGNIFIQPTRSVEYIQLNFISTPTGADFTEIAGLV